MATLLPPRPRGLARYRKTIVALIGAGVAILSRAFGADSTIAFDVVTVATALGVYAVPNAQG